MGRFFFKNKYKKIHDLYKNRNKINQGLISNFLRLFNKKTEKKTIKDESTINFKELKKNYDEIFSLWGALSNAYNFNIYNFLQPIPAWLNKPLSIEEKKLFNILDNSSDNAHINLKKLSNIENYNSFLEILEDTSKKNNINFVDLNKEFLNTEDIDKWLFVDRVHMTDKGYEELAEIVLKNI